MSLHRLPAMHHPPNLSTPRTATTIPHLLYALTSHRAARPQRRHASSPRSTPRKPPSLPPRPHSATPPHHPSSPSPSRPLTPYLWAISLFGATTGLYLSYYLSSYRASQIQIQAQELNLPQNADVSNRWNDASRDYDEEIEFSEKAMFMGRKRRRLLGGTRVEGRVLEVSCGTGRNFGWYDFERMGNGKIEALVFNDQSEVMLGRARGKWEALQQERRKKAKGVFTGTVKGVTGDAGVRGVITRPEGGFDTIVQTMGVCSMRDPVGFLREMNYLVRQPGEGRGALDPEDKGGRILLLEHGRGYYDWVNGLLDRGAVGHAVRYGCWYNKDVGEVVRESGLRVGSVRRYHLGTTWEVVLRPNPRLLKGENGRNSAEGSASDGGKRKSWWHWWMG